MENGLVSSVFCLSFSQSIILTDIVILNSNYPVLSFSEDIESGSFYLMDPTGLIKQTVVRCIKGKQRETTSPNSV
jgi:hypothetical protein